MHLKFEHRAKFGAMLLSASVAFIVAMPAIASPVAGQGTWETTLHARDLDGNGVTDAFYDSTLDITWLRDANVNGGMTWFSANTWALSLVINGYSDWRLPMVRDLTNDICQSTYGGGTDCGWNVRTTSGSTVYSEMASLYYDTLGNLALCTPGDTACNPFQNGRGLKNTGDFVNLFETHYWSSDEFTGNFQSSNAWAFYMGDGQQGGNNKRNENLAMAVHPGDVGVSRLPEPQSWVMVLTALLGLAIVKWTSVSRRKIFRSKRYERLGSSTA